jgi:hypothetical protein
MKLKMKLMAAAVALTAATGANAAMDNFASGNGSLAFIALDSVGTPISLMADLNFNVDSFLPSAVATSAGTHITWNFNTNTLTVNGVSQSNAATTNWSSAYSNFASLAQSTDTKWAVIGGDSLTDGTPGDQRYLTTAAPGTTLATMQTLSKTNLQGFAAVDGLVNANSLLQTTSNASTATTGAPYVGSSASFGTAGKWAAKMSVASAFANEGQSSNFFLLDTGLAVNKAAVTEYGLGNLAPSGPATFSYAAGVLSYDVVAAVPEPETYALFLAGLGMLGFMGRRRLNTRA